MATRSVLVSPPKNGIAADAPQSRAGSSATRCSASVSPGSAPSTWKGPVCGFTKRRSTFSLDRSFTERSAPQKASSDHRRNAVPGVTRRNGATPPNVKAYCSKLGTTSTTSMEHPRNPQVLAAMTSGAEAHAFRGQLRHRRDAEQLHRPGHLAGQDVGGPLHAALAPGHQPVEICPADQAGAGAARHCSDDVGTVHDPAVHVDLGAVTDGG